MNIRISSLVLSKSHLCSGPADVPIVIRRLEMSVETYFYPKFSFVKILACVIECVFCLCTCVFYSALVTDRIYYVEFIVIYLLLCLSKVLSHLMFECIRRF